MALYTYQVADTAGKLVNGSMEAVDEKALVDRLQEMGLYPIKIGSSEEALPSLRTSTGQLLLQRFTAKSVSGGVVSNFTQQLYNLLEAGLPLDKTLSILADLEKNVTFKEIINDAYKGIHKGNTLADCFAKYPKVFSETYVSMIKAGEVGGVLDTILLRLKDYIEQTQKLKDDILSALIYPALLVTVGGGAVALMLFFVLPKFSLIFSDMGGVLPLPTQILLQTSETALKYWWLLFLLIVGGILGFRYYISTKDGRIKYDKLILKLPLFGPLFTKTAASRFSRTLGTLLHAGIPIIDALRITRDTVGNKAVAMDLDIVIEGVRRGKGIAAPLDQCKSFPKLVSHMLIVGEETGKLDEMLIKLSDNFDRETGNTIKRLLSLMEPTIILVMAVVTGFIVISLLLAIFSLNDMPL